MRREIDKIAANITAALDGRPEARVSAVMGALLAVTGRVIEQKIPEPRPDSIEKLNQAIRHALAEIVKVYG